MQPDLPTILRAGQLVARVESEEFLSNPAGVPVSDLGYGAPAVLWWAEPDGERLPCALVASDPQGGMTVACRGTEKIWEWLEDARFAQRQCRWAPAGCMVEEGFDDMYRSTSLQDGSDFRPLLGDPERLSVYGHSLGAAWALQCAADNLAALCIAFASPKLGNQALASFVESRVTAICRPTNSHDVVPLLPCSFLGLLEYRSPGPELALNTDGLIAHGPLCAHHLRSYLHVLRPQLFPVLPDCLP